MDDFERGPLISYELVWTNGHSEVIKAHQVILPQPDFGLFGTRVRTQDFIHFHGEINGHWRLILTVRADDIASVRDKSTEEVM